MTNAHLDDTWIKSLDHFFLGMDDAEMVELVDTLNRHVRHRAVVGSMRDVLTFSLERLAKGDVVLLGFAPCDVSGGHWVLAVGVEQVVAGSSRMVTGVLCLDSGEPEPLLAPFNAKLEINSPARGARYVHYRTSDGHVRSVTCKTAIALSAR